MMDVTTRLLEPIWEMQAQHGSDPRCGLRDVSFTKRRSIHTVDVSLDDPLR